MQVLLIQKKYLQLDAKIFRYKKKFKKNIKQTNNKNIIFFSFQHNSIIDNDPKEIYEKMPAFEKGD